MKVMRFENFDKFEERMNYIRENDINHEETFYSVKSEGYITFDGETRCKNPKTALKRLAKSFDELSWMFDFINGEDDPDYPLGAFKMLQQDHDSYTFECVDDDLWYVSARVLV